MIYKIIQGNEVSGDILIRIEDNGKKWFIPFDPANTSYQEYLAWVAEGNEPEPADE